jgi:hypothetical protein
VTGTDTVVLRVVSSRYDDDHPAWRSQVAVLGERLRDLKVLLKDGEDGTPLCLEVGEEQAPDTATKGVVEVSAVVLASAQIVRAAAVVIREWARQDSGRIVSIEVKGKNGSFTGTGQGGAGVEAVRQALLTALAEGEAGQSDGDR